MLAGARTELDRPFEVGGAEKGVNQDTESIHSSRSEVELGDEE
jgi:hypothetical protein